MQHGHFVSYTLNEHQHFIIKAASARFISEQAKFTATLQLTIQSTLPE